jgi:hypothetical protein
MIIKKFFERIFRGGGNGYDEGHIQQAIFNSHSGAQKNLDVGPWHIGITYVNAGVVSYTTDATTARVVGRGVQLAVFNNTAGVLPIRVSREATPVLGAVGAVGEDFSVVPCKPYDWTHISTGQFDKVLTGSANLLVYVVADDTLIEKKTREEE